MGVRPLAVAFLGRDSAIPERAKMALAAPSVQVGGTTNHVHVLFLLGKQVNLSEIVRPVGSKRQSRTVQQALAEQGIDLRSSSSSLGRDQAGLDYPEREGGKPTVNAAWDAIGEVIKAWATEGHSVAVPG